MATQMPLLWIFSAFLSFTAFLPAQSQELQRKVETRCLCPCLQQCSHSDNGTFINLYYTTATGDSDVMHYVATTHGYPGLLVARTPLNGTLHVDYAEFLSTNMTKSLVFQPPPDYVYTLQFTQLIEYNDVNDTANLTMISQDPPMWRSYDLNQNIPWSDSSIETNLERNTIVFKIHDSVVDNKFQFQENGSIAIEFSISNSTGRGPELPHLQLNSNSSLVDVTVDNLTPSFNQSRFALEIAFITSDQPKPGQQVQFSEYHSIDDESSPGVFQVVDLTARNPKQKDGAYLQWKPVCYEKPEKKVASSTKAKRYDIMGGNPLLTKYASISYAYFGDRLSTGHELTQASFNVSFGLPQDKFYVHTNYSSWQMTVGLGEVPVETVSSLVLIVISVGFGIPVLVILFGGIGICVKRAKGATDSSRPDSSQYSAIN